MASAGRPFTDALLTRLVARGIAVAPITLHTGVSSQEAGEGPQPEWFHVPAPTARLVELTRAHGGRVVATGTTVTRALESAVVDGVVREAWGWTDRVVTPAHPPAVVNGLITGWHDAHASHLLLVEAIAGTALAQAAYDAALAGATAGTSSATRPCSCREPRLLAAAFAGKLSCFEGRLHEFRQQRRGCGAP